MKHRRVIERLRRACISALCASAAILGAMGYLTGEWQPPILLLPLGQAFILLWYLDARLRVLGAEIGDALDDMRTDLMMDRDEQP